MCAMRSHATSVGAAPSESLESRRHRPNQANVRSTTQRRGRSWKPFTPWGALDNLDGPWTTLGKCIKELFAAVDSVGKDVAQPREFHSNFLQQWHGAMAILDVRRMNVHSEKQAIGIGHNVPFTAVDALARVVAAGSASLRGRRTLAVDHRGRRLRCASELFTRAPDK